MGGQSTRMGNDKAFVQWKGKTLLDHALCNLQEITSDIYLSVNTEQFKALSPQHKCIKDLYPDKGPMGGILSGLETLQKDLLVVAVDMPESSAPMMERLIQNSSKVSAFKNPDQKWEPLPSFWPVSITPVLKGYLMNNELSLSSFLNIHGMAVISDANSSSFRNLNRPADLS
ncbi:hypothetical protein BFP97_03750 [Roseivirga sp. 4D4]|nr:hypothetical protein BFP97_03750 [Roseivirga sp. 4D4]